MSDTTLYYYFDFVSPYAYLELEVYGEFCRERNLEFALRPVLFAGLLNHFQRSGPAEIPAIRRQVFADVIRWAKVRQLPMAFPPGHPFNPLLPLRVVAALVHRGQTEDAYTAAKAIFRAIWGDSKPGWEGEILGEILEGAGLNRGLVEAASTPEVKGRLKEWGQEAVANQVFGVPTIRLRNQNLWGLNRVELVAAILEDRDPLTELDLEEILSRPRLADRSR